MHTHAPPWFFRERVRLLFSVLCIQQLCKICAWMCTYMYFPVYLPGSHNHIQMRANAPLFRKIITKQCICTHTRNNTQAMRGGRFGDKAWAESFGRRNVSVWSKAKHARTRTRTVLWFLWRRRLGDVLISVFECNSECLS